MMHSSNIFDEKMIRKGRRDSEMDLCLPVGIPYKIRAVSSSALGEVWLLDESHGTPHWHCSKVLPSLYMLAEIGA